jgi:hypothetical protein
VSGGFNNPIVGGGGALVYPSIHSPGFQHLITGWSVNKDGSAEFENLTLRGTFNGIDYIINNAGAFFYSGIPGPGNLIVAISSASGQDQFGNAYSGPGISVSAPGAGIKNEIMVRPDLNAILIYGNLAPLTVGSPVAVRGSP